MVLAILSAVVATGSRAFAFNSRGQVWLKNSPLFVADLAGTGVCPGLRTCWPCIGP